MGSSPSRQENEASTRPAPPPAAELRTNWDRYVSKLRVYFSQPYASQVFRDRWLEAHGELIPHDTHIVDYFNTYTRKRDLCVQLMTKFHLGPPGVPLDELNQFDSAARILIISTISRSAFAPHSEYTALALERFFLFSSRKVLFLACEGLDSMQIRSLQQLAEQNRLVHPAYFLIFVGCAKESTLLRHATSGTDVVLPFLFNSEQRFKL